MLLPVFSLLPAFASSVSLLGHLGRLFDRVRLLFAVAQFVSGVLVLDFRVQLVAFVAAPIVLSMQLTLFGFHFLHHYRQQAETEIKNLRK